MAKKRKKKHIPQRTCVGCRTVQPKRTMTRVVRTAEGFQIDLTSKLPGRGAYLHNTKTCWEKGLKSGLSRALKIEISPEDRQRISEFMASLPDDHIKSDASGE
ncbi:MAG: YlxR family protein [Anaerolineales bacterium]|nr:YlxR family protein [Chloroflexota bacterium]MBL6980783.1 YlxR family protein [Anaerolineales bacterium]